MSDITCAVCGEPWDAYGVRNGDMEEWEAAKFLRGDGCPSCNFGTKHHYLSDSKNAATLQMDFMESAIDATDDPDALFDKWLYR